MQNLTLYFIIFCILIQITFWIITAFYTKKTSENKGGWTMRIIALIVVGVIIFLRKQISIFIPVMDDIFYTRSLTSGIIADIIVLFGVIIMILARIILGKNWSANVTFKENHELIMSGPYKYVRHPIYSGLLLIILGIAIYSGYFAGFLLFVIFFFGAYYKGIKEEKLLIEHFGQNYVEYKKKVKALIPFVF